MKFIGVDGKTHNVNIAANSYPMRSEGASKSSIQFQCGQLLRRAYPYSVILEEFPVPGSRLYVDFFMPELRVAFEIHGKQHDKFTAHFHGNIKGFNKSRVRDNDKAQWCLANDIKLYEIRSEEEMRKVLGLTNE
jgi:hypothetical protein